MHARDIMQAPVVTAAPDASASQVVLQLTIGRFSGLPISDSNQALVGIVTEFDLIRALQESKDLDTTQVDEDIIEIIQRERIIRVPIVSEGQLVGIVSRGDVLKAALGSKLALYDREISWPSELSRKAS